MLLFWYPLVIIRQLYLILQALDTGTPMHL